MDSGSYNLGFEKRDNYLYARVQADFMDLETAKKYLSEIAERVISDGYTKVLVERDVPTIPGVGSVYFATKEFRQFVGNRKVALVSVYDSVKAEMENVVLFANTAGGNFRLFDTIHQAEWWLLRD